MLFVAPKSSSLNIAHRYVPCSPNNITQPSLANIFVRDALRVASLQAAASGATVNQSIISPSGVSIPAKNGASIGSGDYVATIGLGTPTRPQTVIIDTGSDVSWVQCRPCVSCYSQVEPIFDPTTSSSYTRFPCNVPVCKELNPHGCSAGSCLYGVRYGDGSQTTGYLSSDRFRLTAASLFKGFVFGCGYNNQGLFRGAAGLLGLGRGSYSFVSQTAAKLGKVFSYCLPNQANAVGRLTFGPNAAAGVFYTPLLTNPQAPFFYYIDLIGITVGATKLPVPPAVFRVPGTIIDSGTVVTRLPPAAYAALRTAFRSALSRFTPFQFSLLDTCYDFTGAGTVQIPVVKFHYTRVVVSFGVPGILYNIGSNRYCLAFAGNPSAANIGIIGNIQQRTFNVVYDLGAKKVGFGGGGCS